MMGHAIGVIHLPDRAYRPSELPARMVKFRRLRPTKAYGMQSARIAMIDWRVFHICVQISGGLISYWIRLEKAANRWVICSGSVMVQTARGVVLASRKTKRMQFADRSMNCGN